MSIMVRFGLVAVLLATPAFAQMKGMDMKDGKSEMNAPARLHQASGTVTKVDRAKAAVTIDHGPVSSMKWPAMTMSFSVKDKAMLDKLQPKAKVEFEFVQQGKNYVITAMK